MYAGNQGGGNEDDDVYASFQAPDAQAQQGGWQYPASGTAGQAPPMSTTSGVGWGAAGYQAAANPLAGAALGGRPPASGWGGGGMQSSYGAVPGSQMGNRNAGGGDARPMTSNRASGYTNQPASVIGGGATFDPAGLARNANTGPAPPLKKRGENSPEENCMETERKVNQLVEESAVLAMQGDAGLSLEKAKEAAKKERGLCKQREQLGMGEQINIDLTYSVHFNLAVQYHRNGLYTEALNTYSLIVRNKQYAQSGRLRVNMGNIYAEQKKYLLAIKMYRLALEHIPQAGKDLRFRIMRNIGNCFVRMGQYVDAIGAYKQVMDQQPDLLTGQNLLLCYYALNEKENVKKVFGKLITTPIVGSGEDDDEDEEDAKANKDVLVDDDLRQEVTERRQQHFNTVLTAARLIAPWLGKDEWYVGFQYVIEQLELADSNKEMCNRLASELQMCKALTYMRHKKYKEAIEGLKSFEKDKVLRARAATNLSYLYFLEGNYTSGERYADMSVEADTYNAKALVNKGNYEFVKGEYERAKKMYADALDVESDCVEAMYNLGITSKQLGLYDEALKTFKRLQSLIDTVEVMYQIADLYDAMNDPNAIEWFNRLIGRVPTDPNVLGRIGLLHAKEKDESQAYHYYLEAYRYYQVNMDVISWLGAYFVKNEVYDKAMTFFERAAQIRPHEVKWQLMVASCHRRRGEYTQAKRLYEDIHRRYPENLECLRYLVHLCKDSGLIEEANEWYKKLKRLEARASGGDVESTLGGTSASGHYGDGEASQAAEGGSSGAAAAGGSSSAPAPNARQQAQIAEMNKASPERAASSKNQDDDDDDDMGLPGT